MVCNRHIGDKQGLVVNHQQAYVAMILKPIIEASAEAHALFSGLVSGQLWRNPQLAEFAFPVINGILGNGSVLVVTLVFRRYRAWY